MKTKVVYWTPEPGKLHALLRRKVGKGVKLEKTVLPNSKGVVTLTGRFSAKEIQDYVARLPVAASPKVVDDLFDLSDVLASETLAVAVKREVNAVHNEHSAPSLLFRCSTCGRIERAAGDLVVLREKLTEDLPNVVGIGRYVLARASALPRSLEEYATNCVDLEGKPVSGWKALFVSPSECRLDRTSRGLRVSDDAGKNCPECGETAILSAQTEIANIVAHPVGDRCQAMISTQYWGHLNRFRPSDRVLLLRGPVLHDLARMSFDNLFFRRAVLSDSGEAG